MQNRLPRSLLLRPFAAAFILCALLAAGALLVARPRSSANTLVATDAEIAAAVAEGDARTPVRVRPGRYGPLVISRHRGQLTIESADPLHPASFQSVRIGRSNGVTLRHIVVERRSGEPLRPYAVLVTKSTDIALENLSITSPHEAERGREYAVMMREVSDIRVSRNRISGMRYGIGMLNSRRVTIDRNDIREVQTDGIRGGGIDDLLIAGNIIGRLRPKLGDHADGIQLWSSKQKEPGRRIVIRDNLVMRDEGGIIQGIFVRDTKLQLPFEALEIRGNLVVGTTYHGISVDGAVDPVVADNEVISFTDQKSWIRMQSVRGGALTGNRAVQFIDPKSEGITKAGNITTSASDDNSASRIRAWISAAPERRTGAGPYLRDLL